MNYYPRLLKFIVPIIILGTWFDSEGCRKRVSKPWQQEDIPAPKKIKKNDNIDLDFCTMKGDLVVNMDTEQTFVTKYVLENGMTVLVRPVHTVPNVSLQIWYNVGSKDEKTGERGIAHLIEHMIFKGTNKLSESDINVLNHMLSASTNAFTSYDYTGYLFNIPSHHWQETFPVMADCMVNCSFKEDHLSSEMKAVIQELKMRRDNYQLTLIEDMLSTIFGDHPYHYPIIGFKQDLWTVRSNDLRAFYKKHYWPNNATLVVVGDVKPEEVFKLAEQHFGEIPANPKYKKEEFFSGKDIVSKTVTVYRDVKQPMVAFAYAVPGMREKMEHALDIGSWVLGKGKGSRLYRKLVNELELVTSIEVDTCLFKRSCEC